MEKFFSNLFKNKDEIKKKEQDEKNKKKQLQ